MGLPYGKCALCGKECELTFEHIPPKKAFNNIPQKTLTGDSVIETIADENREPWDSTGLQYHNDQKGMGRNSLCQSCNNLTGKWYGGDYAFFAHGVSAIMQKCNAESGHQLEIHGNCKPLSVIKQVSSMFCSVNRGIKHEGLDALREFVLDKTSNAFPKDKIKITMYLCTGGLLRQNALSIRLLQTSAGFISQEISEIATYPLGFLMYFNEFDKGLINGADMAPFADCEYGKEYNFSFNLPIYECNIGLPADFRTKDELRRCETDTNNDEG